MKLIIAGVNYAFMIGSAFSPPNGYGVMPMTMDGQKMYIHLSVLKPMKNRRSIKMLIDTGAELTAWFQTLTNNAVSIPEKSIRGPRN